jgi:hypothetical protein
MSEVEGYTPKLGVDMLLDPEEATRLIKMERTPITIKMALISLVRERRIRAWLCSDGKLRFQYDPQYER